MADEKEDGATSADLDPSALALSLSGASREKADAFLEKQSHYLDLQMEDLHEQRDLTLSHLQWRRISDWLRVSWQLAAAFAVLLVLVAVAADLIAASQARDLVIDAISVPADLAAQGVTGEASANQVLVRLNLMSAGEYYEQGSGSYRSAAGEDVKVEIPQTGVSIGEVNRFLRGWLGHEDHVSGQIVRQGKALMLALRYGSSAGTIITQSDGDVFKLLQKAAEALFVQDRPLRFADYLSTQGRLDEALAILIPRSQLGGIRDRAHSLTGWALILETKGQMGTALEKLKAAVVIDPTGPVSSAYLGFAESTLGHEQAAHDAFVLAVKDWNGPEALDLDPRLVAVSIPQCERFVKSLEGDTENGAAQIERYRNMETFADPTVSISIDEQSADLYAAHDLKAARRVANLLSSVSGTAFDVLVLAMADAESRGDWKQADASAERLNAIAPTSSGAGSFVTRVIWPDWAVALARAGDTRAADALIAKTPVDCDRCARDRARIDSAEGDFGRAVYWFRAVSERAPSIPFADSDWGEMLLHKGDYDGAIAKFTLANQKGPHFADPLEMWGEALMLKNRSDLALAKFEDANKYAPDWGRLHMKWGEALFYVGHKDEARAQYRLASALDLNVADKAELARDIQR